jgi:uncharacterized membrane protein
MRQLPTPSRLEAFSDGVIAVIITIMVLELKVPTGDGLAGFLTVLPTLGVYFISFELTGVYWINHHHLIDRIKRVDALILWTNLALLFTLSLIPFFTNYVVQQGVRPFPIALYAFYLMTDGLAYYILSKAIRRRLRLSGETINLDDHCRQKAEDLKGRLCLIIYGAAVVVAHWFPWIALALIAAINLIWVVPGFLVERPEPHHSSWPIKNQPEGDS